MSDSSSLPPEYFDRIYRESSDPWRFETSAYEHAKYDATLAALPRDRYAHALEVGSSIGVLTERLAQRCERLQAVDVSEIALERARERCRALSHVTFQKMRIPQAFPDDLFDLILLSEVGYYWAPEDLARALRLIKAHLAPEGQLLLVHWTPYVEDYPLTGDEVHEWFLANAPPEIEHRGGRQEEKYRLDSFTRA